MSSEGAMERGLSAPRTLSNKENDVATTVVRATLMNEDQHHHAISRFHLILSHLIET